MELHFPDLYTVAAHVRTTLPPHASLRVVQYGSAELHPSQTPGFVEDLGLPPAAQADWRTRFSDGSGFHAREEAPGVFDVHWDIHDPTPSLGDRLIHGAEDAPVRLACVCAAIGGLLGLLAGGKGSAGAGAAAGLGFAAVVLAAVRS